MSLETEIAELRGTVTALTEIIKQQVAVQERLLAGQTKAIDTVAAGNPATTEKRTRVRKAKEEAETSDIPNTSAEPADTASGADDAESASEAASEEPAPKADPKPAADAPKEKLTFSVAAKKWLDKEEQGSDAYKARGKTIMGILANFGAAKMSELEAADEDKAMFYLKRAAKGLTINFDAAYDFDGAPDQPEPEAAGAVASDDDDDMFG